MTRLRPLALLLALALLVSVSFAVTEDEKIQNVLKATAERLGWPDTISTGDDAGGSVGTGVTSMISDQGKGDDDDFHGSITTFTTEPETSIWMAFLTEQLDFERTSYQGRDAAIVRYGKNCNPKPLVKTIDYVVEGWIASIFGESDESDLGCVIDHGGIAFTCGKYMFAAADNRDDEGGEEDEIAAALYASAEEAGMCEMGDTLVIMADTTDRPGNAGISDQELMAQTVNEFYGVNSMGTHPPFKFTFKDADGSKGNDDWYHVGQPLSNYPYPGNVAFAADAVEEAFMGADLPQDIYLERVVIVFAGDGHQSDSTASFSNADSYFTDSQYLEVDAALGKRRIYTKNIILLSENRGLGGWVHEFGHSLESKYKNGNFYRISDRYNYDATDDPERQFGESGVWDLMCSGSHWGAGDGDKPTQMASFTKYAAKWLEMKDAKLNESYTINSLESMKKGDAVLRIDDPGSNNPENYMIIEARDATATYGAPASGVVLYQVQWDPTYKHHIVNALTTQTGMTAIRGSEGTYWTPTMYSASPSAGSVFLNPLWEMKITVTSVTRQPFSATVKAEEYKPRNLVGAVANPGPAGAGGGANATTNENGLPGTMPDMDLHAYDAQGNHVGLNYDTGQYENEIAGAIASGNLKDDSEWIFVPDGTKVRYELSTYRTQQFLSKHPEYKATASPQNYTTTMVKFDSQGNRFEADGSSGSASAGQEVKIKGPDDTSLNWQGKTLEGVGNNGCGLFPALLLPLGVFLLRRK